MRSNSWGFSAPTGIRLSMLLSCIALVGCQTTAMGPQLDAADPTPPRRMVTQGPAKKIVVQNLTTWAHTHPKMNLRVAAVGEITANDGTVITVPAVTALQKGLGPKSYDLYNECAQKTPNNT